MPENTDDTRLITVLLVIIGALVFFPIIFMSFGMLGVGPMMGGMWGGGMWGDGTMSGWMVGTGIVLQLLFIAVLVGGAFLTYKTIASTGSDGDQALEELRLAYARGELTEDEYEQRKDTLEGDV